MKFYIAGCLNKWDSITAPSGEVVFKMQGPSIGYLAAFATPEDCKAEFPGRDVIEMETIIIRHKSGVNYPEGGSGEEYEIDICPDCFVGKLVPWLKSEGAKIESSEWNW